MRGGPNHPYQSHPAVKTLWDWEALPCHMTPVSSPFSLGLVSTVSPMAVFRLHVYLCCSRFFAWRSEARDNVTSALHIGWHPLHVSTHARMYATVSTFPTEKYGMDIPYFKGRVATFMHGCYHVEICCEKWVSPKLPTCNCMYVSQTDNIVIITHGELEMCYCECKKI